MRVRVLRPASGILNGVSLSHLQPGFVYELSPDLAQHLIACNLAEAVPDSTQATNQHDSYLIEQLTGGVTVSDAGTAHDKRRRKKKGPGL